MILGRVTGRLWGTRKADRLQGHRLVVVVPERGAYRLPTDHVIALDRVGAEVGQRVVVCLGAPGRLEAGDARTPVDAAVAAIVDDVEWAS